MEADHIALSSLSDEELLLRCYMSRPLMTPMEQELSLRLEHLLNELEAKPRGIGDGVTRTLIEQETNGQDA